MMDLGSIIGPDMKNLPRHLQELNYVLYNRRPTLLARPVIYWAPTRLWASSNLHIAGQRRWNMEKCWRIHSTQYHITSKSARCIYWSWSRSIRSSKNGIYSCKWPANGKMMLVCCPDVSNAIDIYSAWPTGFILWIFLTALHQLVKSVSAVRLVK